MNINEAQNVGKSRELQNTQRISSESPKVPGNSIFSGENKNRSNSSDELALGVTKEQNGRYTTYTLTGNKGERGTLPGGTAVKFINEGGTVTATYNEFSVPIGEDNRRPSALTAENAKVDIPGIMSGWADEGGQLNYDCHNALNIGSACSIDGKLTDYNVQNNAYCSLNSGVSLQAGKNSKAYFREFSCPSGWSSLMGTNGDNAKAETPKVIVSGDAEFNNGDSVHFTGSKNGYVYNRANGLLYEGNNGANMDIDPKSGYYGSGRVFVSKPVKVQEDRGTEKQ